MVYFLIIFLPLLGTIFSGFGGRWLGGRGAGILTTFLLFIVFFFSLFVFFEVIFEKSICILKFFPWVITSSYSLYWGFIFDSLTCVMLIVVTFISSLVHLYSTEYMQHDPHLPRFMSYLSLFTFFMLILVTADNFFQMFVGWEGVGLCSYLLINFWYGRIPANKSALKAMIVNRIGDLGLAMALFGIYYYFSTLEYSVVFSIVPFVAKEIIFFNISLLDFLGFFLFIGAVGKSAQIGLHTWLPDAMEGPTPVSALIHAATMVTAGVFLICRCSVIYEYAPTISSWVTIVGGMTAFLAATVGLLQNDLKRVIAYSTCSQLGYMVFAAGLSSYAVSMFHLSNHAFFKALLFLSAGAVIHAFLDDQDMRKMGGLVKILPFTYSAMFIGSLALMGFPFLAGFYSKDIILEIAYGSFTFEGRFVHILGSLAAFFTAFYSIRLLSLTFLRSVNGGVVLYEQAHESGWSMSLPLFLLIFASIFIGYLSRDMFLGMGTDFWSGAIFNLPEDLYVLESEWLAVNLKLIPLLLSFSGAISAFIAYNFYFNSLYLFKQNEFGKYLYIFLNRKWFFDKIYNESFVTGILSIAYNQTYKNLDRGILEFLGSNGIFSTLDVWTKNITSFLGGFSFQIIFLHIYFIFQFCLFFSISFFLFEQIDWRWIKLFFFLLFF